MNSEQAETAITISALVTTGIFTIRKLTESGIDRSNVSVPEPKLIEDYQKVFGASPPLEWGQFVKAAGSMYIALAIIGAISPDIGGSAAVLIATAAVITNGGALAKDLGNKSSKIVTTESLRIHGQPGGIQNLPQSGAKAGAPLPMLGN